MCGIIVCHFCITVNMQWVRRQNPPGMARSPDSGLRMECPACYRGGPRRWHPARVAAAPGGAGNNGGLSRGWWQALGPAGPGRWIRQPLERCGPECDAVVLREDAHPPLHMAHQADAATDRPVTVRGTQAPGSQIREILMRCGSVRPPLSQEGLGLQSG